LLILYTILCSITIAVATVQETQEGVIFEKARTFEDEAGFSDELVAPKTTVDNPVGLYPSNSKHAGKISTTYPTNTSLNP